jgi:hypothetical protein
MTKRVKAPTISGNDRRELDEHLIHAPVTLLENLPNNETREKKRVIIIIIIIIIVIVIIVVVNIIIIITTTTTTTIIIIIKAYPGRQTVQ